MFKRIKGNLILMLVLKTLIVGMMMDDAFQTARKCHMLALTILLP